METAKELRRELTLAGHEVLLELEEEVLTQGDRIKGSLTVSLSEDGKDPGTPSVTLQEYFRRAAASEDTELTTRTQVRTNEKLELSEFEERTLVRRGSFSFQVVRGRCYPFELRLPRGCRVSQETSGWRLSISLRNDLGIYPDTDLVKLDVRIAAELQAVLDTWQTRLKFSEARDRRRRDNDRGTISLWLAPPPVLASELDGVSLELSQGERGAVEGRVVFDLQEKSVADYLRSLLDQDKVPFDLSLSGDQVLTSEGEPNLDALSQVFSDMLQEVLRGR